MRTVHLSGMIMLAAAAATGQQGLPRPPAGYTWEQIPELTDEFNGSELDTAKWMPRHAYWEGRQPSRFDSANVTVRGGSLRLKSTTRISALGEVKDPMKDVWVSAACVTSKAPICSYGYYEWNLGWRRLSAPDQNRPHHAARRVIELGLARRDRLPPRCGGPSAKYLRRPILPRAVPPLLCADPPEPDSSRWIEPLQ
jgi:hypothetical protein